MFYSRKLALSNGVLVVPEFIINDVGINKRDYFQWPLRKFLLYFILYRSYSFSVGYTQDFASEI